MDQHQLPPVIRVDQAKCVNCHACIAACPVKLCNDGSGDFVSVDAARCIGCGQCLTVCPHGARHFLDDLPALLSNLGRSPMVAYIAPSVAANFPGQYLQLNGWLRSLGVAAVFDVSYGAELYARSVVEHLRKGPRLLISAACPVIVNYLQLYEPELLAYLAPFDTPMGHAMKMVQRFYPQFRGLQSVVISPCLAKKREFAEVGLGDYNVTFASLREHLDSAGVDLGAYAATPFDSPDPLRGVLVPRPGGLMETLEEALPGIRSEVRELHGTKEVVAYLRSFPDALCRHPESVPRLIDCLNCARGCSDGPASLLHDETPDEIDARLITRYRELAGSARPEAFETTLASYWQEEDYVRHYPSRAEQGQLRVPRTEEQQAILRAMHKYSPADLYNCCSCGYGSCEQMAHAISNGLNRPENCHHYLIKERELAQQAIAEYRDHLAQLVEKRTEELRETNATLRQEIAERGRAERALQDSERKLRDVIEALPIPQFVIDKAHRIIHWNKALEQLSGLSAKEMLGTTDHWRAFYAHERPCLADLLIEQDITGLAELYPEGLARSPLLDEAYEGTGAYPSASGGHGKWLHFTASVIRDSRGAIVGAVETLKDVTAQKESERQLAESKLAAEIANQAKSEFLANMSHEIRTPMTAILGFANLLLESVRDPEEVDATKTILRNAEHLLRVINDILDLSKIEAGKLAVERVACSPIALVDDVASLMRVRAEAKNLPLEVDFAWPIPETIVSDAMRIRQVLINLLGNAIKFTEIGKIRLVTRLATEQSPPRLQFEVTDTGIGINDEQLAGLFQPFAQANTSASRKYGGTGLGLAISKRFAELLGGTLSVASRVDQGSRFTLGIDPGPLQGVPMLWQRPADPAVRTNSTTATPPIQLNCRILLVEDGPDNQRLISFLLRRAGAEVVVAQNGVEAVELFSAADQRCFDLVLMDIQMPHMDGYEATRRLRALGYHGWIIALTAHAMKDDRQKCLDAGCDDYLTKPIDRATLLETLARYLARDASPLVSATP